MRLSKNGPRWTGNARLVPKLLAQPLRWRKPKRVFVNSMSDLFHESLSNEEIAAVFGVMAAAERHTFQVLTKRPERMREWFKWVTREMTGLLSTRTSQRLTCADSASRLGDIPPDRLMVRDLKAWPLPNVWLGVSVEDQQRADERIPQLLETPAAVRFVSAEPLLGAVDLNRREYLCADWRRRLTVGIYLDWLIIGGESGPGARPFDVRWGLDLVRQCVETQTACFFKQLGSNPVSRDHVAGEGDALHAAVDRLGVRLPIRDRAGGDPSEWPADLRVRQFPDGGSRVL